MQARGDWRTRKDMRENERVLAAENKLNLHIKKLIETLRIPIKSGKKGYRLPTDLFLAPEFVASPFDKIQSASAGSIKMRPPRKGETGLQIVEE